MEAYSQKVSAAMEDIRRTLGQSKHQPKKRASYEMTSISADSQCTKLLAEIDRLRAVIQTLVFHYNELAEHYIGDPFSKEYEQVLEQINWTRSIVKMTDANLRAIVNNEQAEPTHPDKVEQKWSNPGLPQDYDKRV